MTVRMDITVNGAATAVPEAATVASVVDAAVGTARGGIAVALNGVVLPQASWAGRTLRAGDRVDIVTAMQGG